MTTEQIDASVELAAQIREAVMGLNDLLIQAYKVRVRVDLQVNRRHLGTTPLLAITWMGQQIGGGSDD